MSNTNPRALRVEDITAYKYAPRWKVIRISTDIHHQELFENPKPIHIDPQ